MSSIQPLSVLTTQYNSYLETCVRMLSCSDMLSVCLSVCLSLCLCVSLSVCPSVCVSLCQLSVCPSVCLSVCPSVRLSFHLIPSCGSCGISIPSHNNPPVVVVPALNRDQVELADTTFDFREILAHFEDQNVVDNVGGTQWCCDNCRRA